MQQVNATRKYDIVTIEKLHQMKVDCPYNKISDIEYAQIIDTILFNDSPQIPVTNILSGYCHTPAFRVYCKLYTHEYDDLSYDKLLHFCRLVYGDEYINYFENATEETKQTILDKIRLFNVVLYK
jgi:hypothetical protein